MKKLLSIITLAAFLSQPASFAALPGAPDAVADYLCIGSQFTNKTYGNAPDGRIVSLGNFGGYITYYYADPLTDDPNDRYGVDLYITGNSEGVNIDSLAEPGQVYVSEDGEIWFALAGSEHYDGSAIWDYSITYEKTEDGTSTWTDNYGGSMDYAAPEWPDPGIYTLNNTGNETSYSFTGVLLRAQDNSIYGDGTADAFAAKTRFGYVDYYGTNFRNGEPVGIDPYVEAPARSNGFDLAWAVDGDGLPIDASGMEFHYVCVATASNIYAGGLKEKSTEVVDIVRAPRCEEPVGKTCVPESITVTYCEKETTIVPDGSEQVYDVPLPPDSHVSVETDAENTYINNTRSTEAEGFPKGLVRIITQSGDMEPSVLLLRLTGTANEPMEPTQTPEPTEVPTEKPESGTSHSGSHNISVSFTLYGDTRHGDKEKHIFSTDRGSMPVWVPNSTYIIPEGSTVLYLFEKALTEAGLDWAASGKSYISAVNGLNEFDNGETSGWMYLINGDHAEVGIAYRELKNGDRIIFHYTDDYTAEQGSERYTRGSKTNAKAAEQQEEKKTDILMLHEHEHHVIRSGVWSYE